MRSATRVPRVLTAAAAALLTFGMLGGSAHTAAAADAEPLKLIYLKKCRDLKCEKRITEGNSFKTSGSPHGINRVYIEQAGLREIRIRATGDGISLGCGGTPPVYCNLNGVNVKAWKPERNTALFRFSHH